MRIKKKVNKDFRVHISKIHRDYLFLNQYSDITLEDSVIDGERVLLIRKNKMKYEELFNE